MEVRILINIMGNLIPNNDTSFNRNQKKQKETCLFIITLQFPVGFWKFISLVHRTRSAL